jgi:MFS family permease
VPQSLKFGRDLWMLLIAQAISSVGDYMVSITLSVLVYQLTGSALNVAMVYLVTVLPSVLGLFVGPWLDHLPLKKIMISADLARAVLVGVAPLAANVHLALLYLVIFLATVMNVAFQSARMTVLVDAAQQNSLDKVNSFDQTLQLVGTLVGMAVGGLLSTLAAHWAFWI